MTSPEDQTRTIYIHSNAPWVGSGYGTQCATLTRELVKLGYRVVVGAFYGLQGSATTWEGTTVLPMGRAEYGADVMAKNAKSVQADLVLMLMDAWVMPESAVLECLMARIPVAAWMPVDVEDALGVKDQALLEGTRLRPIAMSRHGERLIKAAGHSRALYVPHMIDLDVFRPLDRELARRLMNLSPETFVVGTNAANKDGNSRKGWYEAMEAFRRFHAKHPDTMWAIHTETKGGLDLERMRDRLGLTKAIKFSDQYLITTGVLGQEDLAGWYNGLDVYLGTSLAEGFGIPHAEAQACGVPVIATKGSAMVEVCARGWLVDGQQTWAEGHRDVWVRPSIPGIVKALEQAHARGRAYEVKRGAAREAVAQYAIPEVVRHHLVPALTSLRMEP